MGYVHVPLVVTRTVQFSSAAARGRALPRRSVLFSGWRRSSLPSRGKSGARVSTSRVSPGRCNVYVIPPKKQTKKKKQEKEPLMFLWRLLFLCLLFCRVVLGASGVFFSFSTAKTRRRSSAPAAFTSANVVLNDDRGQSARSVSDHLIISKRVGAVSLASRPGDSNKPTEEGGGGHTHTLLTWCFLNQGTR